MRRLLALLLVIPVLAGCGAVATTPLPTAHAASPQRADLAWIEGIGDHTERIVFGIRSFEVTKDGWRAEISVENDTDVPLAVGIPGVFGSLQFGLMLFSTGAHSELEMRNANRSLPTTRVAEKYDPALAAQLGSHETWTGTISAGGPVAAGTWARIVFGILFPSKTPALPDALSKANVSNGLVWITDHAYELKLRN